MADTETMEQKPQAPLHGTYTAFDVSDQKEWTKEDLDAVDGVALYENIRAMCVAAGARESMGRRLEIEGAWRLQLIDRGFHRLVPLKTGGFALAYQNKQLGPIGGTHWRGLHDVNVMGVHNDIIVAALTRDIPKAELSAAVNSDEAESAAAAANKLKNFIIQDANLKEKMEMTARGFCTDDRQVWYTRPVADGLRFGFEDDAPDAVPEDGEDLPDSKKTKRPNIRIQVDVFDKLSHKCQIAVNDAQLSPYHLCCDEWDVAKAKGTFPWIAEHIKPGGFGVAQMELDRRARQNVKLAIRAMYGGQVGVEQEVTITRAWMKPEMYFDESVEESAREWLLKNFPKGFLAVWAGTNLAFMRNESANEVLTIVHARGGRGQNRRALTEAYAGPNLVLDNWMDLLNSFFTATIPRIALDAKVFNVDQIRASGNRVGQIEGFSADKVNPNVPPTIQFPMPTHQPALPQFIQYFAGPLAQLLTGAQLTLQGAPNPEGEQGTLGEAEMDNAAALGRLSEPWSAMCRLTANSMLQGVNWTERVQPEGKVFDRVFPETGRMRVEMKELKSSLIAIVETDTNFPESWSEREQRVWQLIQQMPTNQYIAAMMANPANARIIKDAARMGLTISGANSWSKQEGEFVKLLSEQPQPNPQVAQIMMQIQALQKEMETGAAEAKMQMASGQQPNPQAAAMLQQGVQTIQQLQQQAQSLPPLISSVQVRQDDSEEHAIEEACCLMKMISPEGRRLANSGNEQERAAFANLHLHWAEHKAAAAKVAAENQQPVEPKSSITMAVDKMPGAVQSELLAKLGVIVPPEAFDQMGPHEVTHEIEGVNADGAQEKVKTSLVGKQLD